MQSDIEPLPSPPPRRVTYREVIKGGHLLSRMIVFSLRESFCVGWSQSHQICRRSMEVRVAINEATG